MYDYIGWKTDYICQFYVSRKNYFLQTSNSGQAPSIFSPEVGWWKDERRNAGNGEKVEEYRTKERKERQSENTIEKEIQKVGRRKRKTFFDSEDARWGCPCFIMTQVHEIMNTLNIVFKKEKSDDRVCNKVKSKTVLPSKIFNNFKISTENQGHFVFPTQIECPHYMDAF